MSPKSLGNSAERSLWIALNSVSHFPWVVRSKLSVSLPMGRSTGQVIGIL
ncbi:hypothetical protein MAL08_03345 [Leptospira noguchii]|nr:hypothetical protein [Leptospira noguchii]UOG38380.1 hypothetical protein MAL08_03345 [Leptospira noguchii]